MVFLWLSIICSTLIYFLFKIREKFNVNLSGAIIINYLMATLLGLFLNSNKIQVTSIISTKWFPFSILIGFLFVLMFFLIGISSEKTGITLTSIATRMSMVLPMIFSMLFFGETISLIKIGKISLTLIAVILAIYRKPDKTTKSIYAILPIILFIGSGSVDTLVKTAQHLYIPQNEIDLFSSSLFGISFIMSLFLFLTKKPTEKLFNRNTFLLGIALGLVNYGSLNFLINALNKSGIESSIVFGINNLAIVCLSLIIGKSLFHEKLTKTNWLGIILSIACIIFLIRF